MDVLENIISTLTTVHFTRVLAIPIVDDFLISCSRELFLNQSNYFRNTTVGKNAANNLNLHSHDLRVPVGSLSRFKLSLPQCNVPGVLNCMSGRLSRCPSLY